MSFWLFFDRFLVLFFSFEGGHTLKEFAQRVGRLSVIEDIQNLTRQSSGQPNLAILPLNWRLDCVTTRGPFQHKLFCDFIVSVVI